MSHENVELIGHAFEAWNERGLDGLREYLHPDFEYHEDPRFPESGVYRGREAFEEYARKFLGAWEAYEWQLEEAVAAGGDTVLANLRARWRGEASGVEVEVAPGWIVTIRDGKVVRCDAFLDRDQALEALGVSE